MRASLVKQLQSTPILKLLIPLMAGILAAKYIEISSILLIILSLSALISALVFTNQYRLYNLGWYVSMFVFFFLLGVWVFKAQFTAPVNYERLNKSKYFIGIVNSLAEPVKTGQRYEMKIVYYRECGIWKACNAKVILYVKKHLDFRVHPGQYLLINNVLLRLQQESPFPYNKSQSEYYFLQNISGQIYAESAGSIQALPLRSRSFLYPIQQLREKLLTRAGVYFTAAAERSIFQSLFFGYRAEMDRDLTNAYATAGVIHILSVSGLHVGIIYLFFIFITGPLNRNSWTRILRTLIIVVAIWFYGLLAGFSPPVIRSCCMFSILGLGQLIQRETFPFNSLFLSAFIILLISPCQIFDVGFQLSYAAMGGIFLFYQPFCRIIDVSNYVGKKMSELVAVSLAAQLGTLPFSLYYFNSFPLYFLVSNLVIVPFTTLIMYTGIAFLLLMPFGLLAAYVAELLTTMIAWLNQMVLWIEHLPYASIKGFYPNTFETILLLCLILFLAYLIYFRNFKVVPFMLSLIVFYQVAEMVKFVRGNTCRQLVIVRSYPAGFICFHHQNRMICLFVDTPPQYVDRYLNNYRKNLYVQDIRMIQLKCQPTLQNKHAYKIQLENIVLTLSCPVSRSEVNKKGVLAEGSTEFFLSQRCLLTITPLRTEEKIPIEDHGGYYLINLN